MQRTDAIESERPGAGMGEPGRAWRRWLPLAVLLGLAASAFALGLHRRITLETLILHREALRGFVGENLVLALAGYLGVYVAVVAMSLPASLLLTVTGGFLFGWAIGGAAALTGATAGAIALFSVARSALGAGLAERAGPAVARFAAGFRRDAAAYMLFLRLVPAFPFFLVNLAPALLGAPLGTFAWTTLVGMLPVTFAIASIGAGLDGALAAPIAAYEACRAAGQPTCTLSLSMKTLITRELIAAFAVLGCLALLPVLLRRTSLARRWQAQRKGH